MRSIVIDQSKIRIDEKLATKGAAPFPRPLEWWDRTLPVWVTVSESVDGLLILEPNGKVADGRQLDLTPVQVRNDLKAIRQYLSSRRYLDFSDALVQG